MADLTGGLGFGGKFLQGFAKGRMYKFQREQELKDREHKEKLFKFEEAKMKQSEAQEARKEKMFNLWLQTPEGKKFFGIVDEPEAQPGESKPTPMGPSLKESSSGGLTDKMAESQMSGLGSALMKDVTGIDFLSAGRLDEQRAGRTQQQSQHEDRMGMAGGQLRERQEGTRIAQETLDLKRSKAGVMEFETGGVKYRQRVNEQTKEPVGPPIAISGKKGLPAETAGKLGMLQSGLDGLRQAKEILMPGGAPDYKAIGAMQTNFPWSDGRTAGSLIDDALEGKVRIESGAAVPPEEIKRMAKRFKPSVGDSPDLIALKMDRLERYLTGTIEKIDPNKNYPADSVIVTGEDGNKYMIVPASGIELTEEKATMFWQLSGGDRKKAEKMARDEGYKF